MSHTGDEHPSCRAAAFEYLARGWSVIPIEPRGKRPLVPWLELQNRLPSSDEVAGWFARWPDANVGVVTGALSGIVVVDLDERHGAARSLRELEAIHGALPRTVAAATGGGGQHVYFAHPGGIVRNMVGLAPGIDLRGDGGCVVAPPSLHASGRRYAWIAGCSPDDARLSPLPQWFGRLARRGRVGHPLAHWRKLVRRRIPEGERNSTIVSLAGHLFWHEVDIEVALELLTAWNQVHCEPPLPFEEVVQTVESIARLHERRREGGQA